MARRALEVTGNRRYLRRSDGTPFFYLGDTARELFHRPIADEPEHCLTNRAAQSVTVVQAVLLEPTKRLGVSKGRGAGRHQTATTR